MRGVRPWLGFAITAALLGAAASWRNGTISRNTTTTKTTAKLVLLSAPRSGSTLLVEMLRAPASDACPFHASDLRASAKDGFAGNVSVRDDVFGRRRSSPGELLDAIADTASTRAPVVGFKLFSKHLEWENLPVARARVKVRELDVAISPELFEAWRDHEAAFAAYARRAVASLDADDRPALLELWYEADLCAPERRRGALAKVERFLGVPGGRFRHDAPHLPVKQHAHNVFESVSNWAAVANSTAGAPYATATSCSSRRRLADETADAAAARKKHLQELQGHHCKEGGPGWL
ncbi:phytanoyl-CoA dioxygenase [Aureococcus anophagefferens]|nr:phytanoyl-CoA dioxygenase [Aureococcus anophagefferens]